MFSVRPTHTTPWYGDHIRVSGALVVIYKNYFDHSPEDIPKSKEDLERFLTKELGMSDQLAHHERVYIIDTLANQLDITEERSSSPNADNEFSSGSNPDSE